MHTGWLDIYSTLHHYSTASSLLGRFDWRPTAFSIKSNLLPLLFPSLRRLANYAGTKGKEGGTSEIVAASVRKILLQCGINMFWFNHRALNNLLKTISKAMLSWAWICRQYFYQPQSVTSYPRKQLTRHASATHWLASNLNYFLVLDHAWR